MPLKFSDRDNALEQFCSDISSGNAVCLAGAGVSMVPPSRLPSGPELRDTVTSSVLQRAAPYFSFSEISSKDNYRTIVPEVVFGAFYPFLRKRLYRPFKLLSLAEQNSVHKTLAALHVEHGLPIFTTNFEDLIERNSPEAVVRHLHGDISQPKGMFILINQIVASKRPPYSHELEQLRGRNLYVFGYSGNDKDVVSVINKSKFRNVFWLMRSEDDAWTKNNLDRLETNVVPFVDELQSFFLRVSERLFMPPFTSPMRTPSPADKEKIVSSFTSSITRFEAICMGAMLSYRIQEYMACYNALRAAIRNESFTRKQSGRIAIFLAESGRVGGVDENELIPILVNEVNSQNDGMEKAELLNSLGIIYLKSERHEEARPYFLKALEIFHEISKRSRSKNRRRAQQLYSYATNNLGLCLYNGREYFLAYRYFFKSYLMKRRVGDMLGLVAGFTNLSITALLLQNRKHHKLWDRRAMDLIAQYGVFHRHAGYLIDLAEAFIALNNQSAAADSLTEAEKIIKEHIPNDFSETKRIERVRSAI